MKHKISILIPGIALVAFVLAFVVAGPALAAPYVEASISTDAAPSCVDVNSTTNRIYTTHWAANTISVLDGNTNTQVASIPVNSHPTDVTVMEANNRIFVCCEDSNVVDVIDGNTNTVISSIPCFFFPYRADVDESTHRLFVTRGGGPIVRVINGDTYATITEVPFGLGTAAVDVCVNPVTRTLFIDSFMGGSPLNTKLSLMNIDTYAVGSLDTPNHDQPSVMALDTGLNKLYMSTYAGIVHIFDPVAEDFTGSLNIQGPYGIAVNSSNHRMYVANAASMSLSVYNTGNDSLVAAVPLDGTPYQVACIESTCRAYVCDNTQNWVDVIQDNAFCVTNTNNSGAGSLNDAIEFANAHNSTDITFCIPGAGPHAIQPVAPLPDITNPVNIDGYTQPGTARATAGSTATLGIELDGSSCVGGNEGFGLDLQTGDSHVDGLVINRFPASGIRINGGNNSTIEGCYVGTDVTGTVGQGNGQQGIEIQVSSGTIIGGATPGERNVISGQSGNNGIAIANSSTFNMVQGNFIGTNATGDAPIPNLFGVYFWNASHNSVGGPAPGDGNLISGNLSAGVTSFGGNNNTVSGNLIGTDATGLGALPNRHGIVLNDGTNTIGGAAPGVRNVIAGNTEYGVVLNGSGNMVYSNWIGLNVAGSPLGNLDGVYLTATANFVGDTGIGNVISGNAQHGINAESDANTISGNLIGTNPGGTAAAPNLSGLLVEGSNTTVMGNVISGNVDAGICNEGTGTDIQGNVIGTTADGSGRIPNEIGVELVTGYATIGGDAVADPSVTNTISGNETGVWVRCSGNALEGNMIGTDPAGATAVWNDYGVWVDVNSNTIGGNSAGFRNVISGNTSTGLTLKAGPCVVYNNVIGLAADGASPLSNGIGIEASGGQLQMIGDLGPHEGNVVSGNISTGIEVSGSPLSIRGNLIGVDANGAEPAPNGGDGISLVNSSGFVESNVISGNSGNGVSLSGGSSTNRILTNHIGALPGGGSAPNGGSGVLVGEACTRNRIESNSIYSNGDLGIKLIEGGNDNYPAPVIQTAVNMGGSVARLTGTASAGSRVQIFNVGPIPDPSGAGEGLTFMGNVLCDDGTWAADIAGFNAGDVVSATAVDLSVNADDTSQFGLNKTVIDFPAPTLTYIHADCGPNDGPIPIGDVHGSGFRSGADVLLKKTGQTDIVATGVQVLAPDRISCTFDLTGAACGKWDVVVINDDLKTATLAQAFTVTLPAPVVTSVSPPQGEPGTRITVQGSDFGATQGGSAVTIGGVEAQVASWSDTEIVVIAPAGGSGPVVVTTAGGGSNTDKDFTLNSSPTWYLAEGTTAWGFSTYITIQNPNDSAVTAKITYMNPALEQNGRGRVLPPRQITLPAESQTTIDPRWDLGDTDFSTRVECLQGKNIAVDRTMFWTGPDRASDQSGYHSSIGVTSPSKTWYLPEGSSNWGFETWTLVENPASTAAEVTLTYMTQDAGAKTFKKTLPAFSRASYNMVSDIGSADASIQVTADVPVIAERSMYRNNKREGSCSIGATAPANDFFLAEGATGYDVGFNTYVLIQNPNDTSNQGTLTFQTQAGEVEGPSFTMLPNSRMTIRLNDHLPENTNASTMVHGSKPLIAERAMYWDNGTGEAFHASIGLADAHMAFMLPDGQTSGGCETWTLVANPNPGAVTVRVTYLPQDGGKAVSFTDEIAPGTRATYPMADKVTSGRASILVQSLDGARPIMVERSMYWNNRGAGTDTIGGFSD